MVNSTSREIGSTPLNFGEKNKDENSDVAVSVVFNPTALRKAKIVYNFVLSECNRVNFALHTYSCRGYIRLGDPILNISFMII